LVLAADLAGCARQPFCFSELRIIADTAYDHQAAVISSWGNDPIAYRQATEDAFDLAYVLFLPN